VLRVTTIGSGTGAPSPARVSSAHLVEVAGLRLLMDCGSGAVFRMSNLAIDWMGITHVLVSHFHADHVSDIPTLVYAWRYGSIPARSAPVQLIGPPGFSQLFDRLDAVYDSGMRALGFPLNIIELAPGATVDLSAQVQLSTHKVPHTNESVAYSIRTRRRRIVYSGDTSFDPALAEWALSCDLLLAECSLPAEMAVAAHMTPEQCGQLAALARPAALALTHFYPPLETVDVAGIVSAQYDGPVHLTYDGWTMELED